MKFDYLLKLPLLLVMLILSVDANAIQENLFDRGKVFVDSTNELDIGYISSSDFTGTFVEVGNEVKEQSFTNYTYWFKIDPHKLAEGEYYLISKNVFIDHVVLYVGNSSEWSISEAGMLVLDDGKFEHSVISLKLPEIKDDDQVYVSFQSNCISMLDVWLVDALTLTKDESFKFTFYSVILSFILIYLAVVLFLYFFTKTKGLPYFIFYGLASIGMILFTNGYLYQYGPLSMEFFYKWSFVYFVDLYWAAAVLLSYHLLRVAEISVTFRRVYFIAIGFLGLMLFSPLFMERQVAAQLHFVIPTLYIFFNVVMGVIIYIKEKNRTALLLSVGWIVYFAFLGVWSMSKTGMIETSFFVDNCPVFGIIFEFVLFGVIAAQNYIQQHNERILMRDRIENIDTLKLEVQQEFGEIYDTLSAREKEVLQLLASGLLDKEISDQLGITVASVRTYSKRIYTKLNVSNRTEASLIYNKVILTQLI